jgi:hypothetical protein
MPFKRDIQRHFISIMAILLFPGVLCATDLPRMTDVKAEIVNGQILASAELLHGFQPHVLRDLHNGIPKDFYYYFVLNRKYKNWIDEEVYEKTIRHTVLYDILKKQYRVTRHDGAGNRDEIYDDLESVQRAALRLSHITLLPVRRLRSDHRYYLGVKAQMKAAQLPLYLKYFLFFIPVLEMDTPWADSDVIQGIP